MSTFLGGMPDAAPQAALAPDPVPLHIDRVHLLHTVPGACQSSASWPLSGASQDA